MILFILFLVSILILGYILTQRLSASFIIGSLFGVSSIFVILFLFKNLYLSFLLYFFGWSIFLFVKKKKLKNILKINNLELVVYSCIFIISFILFDRTFSYDISNNSFLIQSNLYQDFGSRISHIRYFSNGGGIIPEVPYFAGMGLLYHFFFELYAGIGEFLGTRIDITFNIISAFSITSLIFLLYEFSLWLFKDKLAGILTPIIFILGSDLSFIQLVNKYGFNLSSYYHHNSYLVGELLGNEFGRNFLNINTIVNQRHLIFAFGVFVFIIHTVLARNEKLTNINLLFMVLIISLLPFWHVQIVVVIYIVLVSLAFLLKHKRKEILKILLLSGVFVLPQLLLIKINSVNELVFRPGFTIANNLSVETFSLFWIWNLGFAMIFAIFGFIKSDLMQRKVFLSMFSLFIIANLFQFGRDIFDNHKFFNVFFISISMFSAYAVSWLFQKKLLFKVIAILGIVLITASGFFNVLVIKNDVYAKVSDSLQTSMGRWVKNNIPNNDIVLTNGEIYDPASLLGVRTFLGRTHYIFLFGGNPDIRISEKNKFFAGENSNEIKRILSKNEITYIIVYKEGKAPNLMKANLNFINGNFRKVYEDSIAIIYKI